MMGQPLAFALTLGVETVIGSSLLWRWGFQSRRTLLPLLIVVVAASAITHPFAWHANRAWLRHLPFESRAAIIESAVIAVEAAVLWLFASRIDGARLRLAQALLLSLASNLASFAVGLAVAYA